MEIPPLIPTPPKIPSSPKDSVTPFAKQAAKFSVFAPIVAFIVNIVAQPAIKQSRVTAVIIGGTACLMILLGFIFAIVALIGIKKHGSKGILTRALVGLFLNGFIILFALLAIPRFLRSGQADNRPRVQNPSQMSLTQARKGFITKLTEKDRDPTPTPMPPKEICDLVQYPAPLGNNAAYLSPSPNDGKKHPAIIWIFGGFGNGIGETAWEKAPASNDQSASAFRNAGIIMMYPSLRGGNRNPGFVEGFYGEVDDILAARDFLAQQDYVDPDRIYLGGHSTGGTLALLVAESTSHFRAVFAFGPVGNPASYGQEMLPFKIANHKEVEVRAPILWLNSIHTPTFVFEGEDDSSNIDSLHALAGESKNPLVHFYPVPKQTHFSVLAPTTKLIASKILDDAEASKTAITFSQREFSGQK